LPGDPRAIAWVKLLQKTGESPMRQLFFLIILLIVAGSAQAEDAAELVQSDCMSCHGDEVYTRENRMVRSLDGLRQQIGRCHLATGKDWTPDQVESVVQYLNGKYYKF